MPLRIRPDGMGHFQVIVTRRSVKGERLTAPLTYTPQRRVLPSLGTH